MIICPECGTGNPNDARFCEACGTQLFIVEKAIQSVRASMPTGNLVCPACSTPAMSGQMYCEECGAYIGDIQMDDSEHGGVDTGPAQPIIEQTPIHSVSTVNQPPASLSVVGYPDVMDLSTLSAALLGREDPALGLFPELDLGRFGGMEGGVSRQHARIAFDGKAYTLEDLNSVNGTFWNQTRLEPGNVQTLHDGDQIRLGRVVLRFSVTS